MCELRSSVVDSRSYRRLAILSTIVFRSDGQVRDVDGRAAYKRPFCRCAIFLPQDRIQEADLAILALC